MMDKSFLGIYLTDKAVTGMFVEKDKKHGGWGLKREFHHSLPSGLIKNGQIIRPQELLASFKPIIRENKLSGKRVNFLADTSYTVNRLVTMPAIANKELKEAVFWEIKPLLSLDMEEIFFDYVVLMENKEQNLQQVYIAALAKKLAIEYLHFLKKVGLAPWRIESKWMALFRLWKLLADEAWNKSEQDCLTCLLLAVEGKGQFVASDYKQGFTVRQMLFGEQVEKVWEEYNHISFYLQEKYQKILNRVMVIGKLDDSFRRHLTNLGEEVSVIDWPLLLNCSPVIGEMGLHLTKADDNYLVERALALSLVLGEVSNDAN